jgi:DNA repair exonuclease SbcCD ATPase subunit
MLYFTQFIIILLKTFEKLTTLSTKTKIRSDKYTKKLKGKTTNEAKTQADFDYVDKVSGEVGSLNQTARGGTDKAIRNVFGDLDDFLNTSMSSQLGALGFINEGSTRRKEILAKFLDLEFFEKKFKLAKEDAADLRGALRRIQDVNYDDDIKNTKDDIFRAGAAVAKQKSLCTELKDNLSSVSEENSRTGAQVSTDSRRPYLYSQGTKGPRAVR